MRRSTWLIALLALGFFAAPAVALIVGVRAHPFENRPLAKRPSLDGFGTFDQITRYATDHLPGREQAVHANTDIQDAVFGTVLSRPDSARSDALPFGTPQTDTRPSAPTVTAPTPPSGQPPPGPPAPDPVLQGQDGWLYFGDEINIACLKPLDPVEAVRRWKQLIDVVAASGRRIAIVVAPEKSAVYPEHLPAGSQAATCAPAGDQQHFDLIAGAHDPRLTGLRDPILALKARQHAPVYRPRDTHWTTPTSVVGLRAILRGVGADRQADAPVKLSAPMKIGDDLSALLGKPTQDTDPSLSTDPAFAGSLGPSRPTGLPGGQQSSRTQVTPHGLKLLPGRTTLLYDSFGIRFVTALNQRVADLTQIGEDQRVDAAVQQGIAQADTVLIEVAERIFYGVEGQRLTPAFFDGLQAALRARAR